MYWSEDSSARTTLQVLGLIVLCFVAIRQRRLRRLPDAGRPVRVVAGIAKAVSDGRTAMTITKLAFDQIKGWFDQQQARYQADDEHLVLETAYNMPTATFNATVLVTDDPAMAQVHVYAMVNVPEDRRAAMAETIVRANCGLKFGHFDLHFGHGGLRFYAAMPLARDGIEAEQFEILLGAALGCMNQYFRAFARLLYGDDLSPAEVIAEVEMAEQ